MELLPLVAAVALGLVHLLAWRLRFLQRVPRSRWLSAAGGVSVAYVFVHLLPELNEAQEAVGRAVEGTLTFLEDHVYLVALVGLAVYYGLERAAVTSRRGRRERGEGDATGAHVFALSMASFLLYNGLIGYTLVHRIDEGTLALVLFATAMGVHFAVNDVGLEEHHQDAYRRVGRWLLAAAVVAGWAVGMVVEISEAALGLLLAFLAGGVVLNVLKEELPEERESRFAAFAVGAAAYAGLLLAL